MHIACAHANLEHVFGVHELNGGHSSMWSLGQDGGHTFSYGSFINYQKGCKLEMAFNRILKICIKKHHIRSV